MVLLVRFRLTVSLLNDIQFRSVLIILSGSGSDLRVFRLFSQIAAHKMGRTFPQYFAGHP